MIPTIDIAVEYAAWNALGDLESLARSAIEAALARSGAKLPPSAELSLVLCDDPFIAALNQTWRGIAKPTNVLSFPTGEGSSALGDIVIAYETVLREAADDGKPPADHLSHMIVHGVLHLLGFDHEDDDEADAMEALETAILADLGIAPPFAPRLIPVAEDTRLSR